MPRFPFYRQQYQMDCGAACVKMICGYYGKDVPIDSIRKDCNVGADGVSLKGICNAMGAVGLKTVAGKVNYPDLCQKAILPCILHWEQNHFIVLYRIQKKGAKRIFHIADPDKGLLHYNEREFKEGWIATKSNGEDKGTALLCEPGLFFSFTETQKEDRTTHKASFLWEYFKKYKSWFFLLLASVFVSSILVFLFPFLTKSIVDVGISHKSIDFVLLILIGQMALILGKSVIDFIQARTILHIGARINITLISDFFIKLMKLPMSFFDTKLFGDILQRIDDHKRINNFLTQQIIGIFLSILTFVTFGLVLFLYEKTIFGVFMLFSMMYGLWLFCFLKKRRTIDYKLFSQQAKNQSNTYQLIESIQETKLHNAEDRKRWEWEDIQTELFETNMDMLELQQTQGAGGILINEMRNALITVIAASSVINGDSSLGVMVAIQFIAGQLSYPVEKIMNFIYQWQDVSISLDRIQEIHTQNNENHAQKIKALKNYDHTIRFSNVDFHYPGVRTKNVLNNISFEVEEGETVAIVGPSGSGKTTLLKLLLGYYPPTSGTIMIGNIPLSELDTRWWHDQCGVVMQNGYIYADTISGNIAVADNHPDIDRLHYAAKISSIDRFIRNLPLKYDTLLGESGQGLSQGQKQRILIARAVYKSPEYLFLDEATNSLDANTEKDIVAEMDRFYKGRTVLIIAHRLSTVRTADKIIVLNEGQIVEQGTHDQLIAKKGYYLQLIKNQLELDD